jgi:hypothetical protein
MWRVALADPDPHAQGLGIDIGLVRFWDSAHDFNYNISMGDEPYMAQVMRPQIIGFPGVSQHLSPWWFQGTEDSLGAGRKNALVTDLEIQHNNHLHLSFLP